MWNDFKVFCTALYNHINGWLWAAIFAGGIFWYFGKLVVNCNQYLCTLMLK